jgi:hypothetical protein
MYAEPSESASPADQLWSEDARRAHALLADGRAAETVEHYFATVAQRWDVERLVITEAGLPAATILHPALADGSD